MKTIKLNSYGVGRYGDVSPFLVTDNKLRLSVELPPFNGEFYLIAENNGTTQKKLLSKDSASVLENLTAGVLNTEVKHYAKGELVKVYKVEPLLLREADGELSVMPEIEALHRDISFIERAFADYRESAANREKERGQALEERIKAIETNLIALIAFAFRDYRENVYLGGGSWEQFSEEFGFALNPEQIKSIQGEKEND